MQCQCKKPLPECVHGIPCKFGYSCGDGICKRDKWDSWQCDCLSELPPPVTTLMPTVPSELICVKGRPCHGFHDPVCGDGRCVYDWLGRRRQCDCPEDVVCYPNMLCHPDVEGSCGNGACNITIPGHDWF